nr:flagellar hook-basal body complex protein FliE [Hoeflea prorocentri]
MTREAGNTAAAASPAVVAPGKATATQESEFASMLSSMVADMTATIRHGEQMSMKGINGEANTKEVVDAVMSAERTLQTALAVRDKIVTAYLEISRMPI